MKLQNVHQHDTPFDANELVTVYVMNDPYEAEIIRNTLRGQGIPCELNGERQAGLVDILKIGVLVRADDSGRARKIIRGQSPLVNGNEGFRPLQQRQPTRRASPGIPPL